jgi:hypothetical protein
MIGRQKHGKNLRVNRAQTKEHQVHSHRAEQNAKQRVLNVSLEFISRECKALVRPGVYLERNGVPKWHIRLQELLVYTGLVNTDLAFVRANFMWSN